MIHLNQVPSEDKFRRNFQKRVSATPFALRLRPVEEDRFFGAIKADRFFLFRQKRLFFSLFAVCLVGKRVQEKGVFRWRLSFRRPLASGLILGLTALLLVAAGAPILFSETLFSLCFLLPAGALFFSLFFFSKREKDRLLALFHEINRSS